MSEFLNGYKITNDDQTTEMWSLNRLYNGDAEQETNGWTSANLTVVDGGPTKESLKTFELIKKVGEASQTVANAGAHPPSYLLKGAFLPEKAVSKYDTLVSIYVRVTVTYGDGSEDLLYVPVRPAVAIGADGPDEEEATT